MYPLRATLRLEALQEEHMISYIGRHVNKDHHRKADGCEGRLDLILTGDRRDD